MKIRALAAWMLVTGSVVHLAGCASVSGHGSASATTDPASASVPPATASRNADGRPSALSDAADGTVVAAVAATDPPSGDGLQNPPRPSPVRWTAGILEDSAATVKQGVNKVTDAFTPAPATPASDDPVLLSSKAKPSPELYARLAQFYEQSGKPQEAERTYQQSVRLWPKHLGTALNYARFKDRQGLPQEAYRLYQDAAKAFPKEAAVYNDMGLFFARAGRNQEALRAFGQAIQLQPKRPLYRNNLAVLLVDMGQPDQALTQLKAVCGEAEAYYKVGYLMQKKGRSREAELLFADALRVNPNMPEARAWLDHLRSTPSREIRVAQRPTPPPTYSPGANSAPPPVYSPGANYPPNAGSPPSIIRDVRAEPSVGPRAGPRSLPEPQEPPAVRPLPGTVTPLPRVSEDINVPPPGGAMRGGPPWERQPPRGGPEPGAAASDAPLPPSER